MFLFFVSAFYLLTFLLICCLKTLGYEKVVNSAFGRPGVGVRGWGGRTVDSEIS